MSESLKQTFGVGYTGKCIRYKGIGIWERIVHWAYARNGNTHNPTAYKAWDIFMVGEPGNGAPYLSCRTVREAKELIDNPFSYSG